MEAILKEANEQYRVLYALLAGCGPMRAGEALGLEIDKHISEDCRTLYIRQKAKRGILQPYTKTRSGTEVNLDGECIGRDVDLCSPLATMLRVFIGDRKSGLLFCRPNGLQVLQRTVLKMSLHRILDNPELEKGGFNIFRRFRITHIKTSECPDFLQHFWSGHASTHVSERYTKLLKDREFRHGIHLAKALKWLTWLTYSIPKSWLSCLESGGREGIRTPGLLVANEEKSKLRLGITIT